MLFLCSYKQILTLIILFYVNKKLQYLGRFYGNVLDHGGPTFYSWWAIPMTIPTIRT